MSSYFQKLRDPRWQKMRLQVMERNEFCCEMCGDSTSTLNVHHKAYFKDREPWDYLIEQLSCLCEGCHEQNHKNIDPLKFLCSLLPLSGIGSQSSLCLIVAGILNFDYNETLKMTDFEDCEFASARYAWGKLLGEKL
jgi:hypothetical protein